MSSPDTKIGGLTRTLKDLFAGAAGGVAQVLLGQWIKVYLMANNLSYDSDSEVGI